MAAYVYILASGRHGTLYVGSTTDLANRLWQHRSGAVPGFTSRFRGNRIVWYEMHEGIDAAALRERQIKKWNRDWKIRLIEENNPDWHDLHDGWLR